MPLESAAPARPPKLPPEPEPDAPRPEVPMPPPPTGNCADETEFVTETLVKFAVARSTLLSAEVANPACTDVFMAIVTVLPSCVQVVPLVL